MFVIGIVGGIGSGKSMISNTIENLYNAYILEADKIGHDVMLKGNLAYEQVVQLFGKSILDQSGEINRQILGDIVYNDEGQLEQLNNIIHKEVFSYLRNHLDYLRSNPIYDVVIIEAALLIVDSFMPLVDSLWYIKSDEDIRIKRLIKERQMKLERIQQIMTKQPEEAFYESHADVIIVNNTDIISCIASVNKEITKLWRNYNDSI